MDTIPVAPVGSAIAPAAIADRGQRRRRQQEREKQSDAHHHDEQQGAGGEPPAPSPSAPATPVAKPPTRDDAGHIDCFG